MSRGRVILVNPKMCSPRSVRMPLSVLAIGAVLEGKYDYLIVDGNVDADPVGRVLAALAEGPCPLVGMTVMPGPQVGPAVEMSAAVRAAHPHVPVAWGGYFPTLYPDAAINAPYVDYLIRGQGEETVLDLLARLPAAGPPPPAAPGEPLPASAADVSPLRGVDGLTWRDRGRVVHNADRAFRPPDDYPPLPYHRAGDVARYLRPSFMGTRTAVHQAAIGCRYRCGFCGVVSMFNGVTKLSAPARFEQALTTLRRLGANAVQFYDHNFFDREDTSGPVAEVLARVKMPWWCYARADTLAGFSAKTWDLLRQSQLRMAYIGAEAASDDVLRRMKKGTRVEQTFEVAQRCREYGIIPEFSFVLGGPDDPAGEVEKTFAFVKRIKHFHPGCEVVLYFYSPTPQRDPGAVKADRSAPRLPVMKTYGAGGPGLPTTPEEWTQPRWIDYVCHRDAPWLTPGLRQRVRDFAQVLACRFPTAQDYSTPRWGKSLLRGLATWRYTSGRYGKPWELDLARRLVKLRQPQTESL